MGHSLSEESDEALAQLSSYFHAVQDLSQGDLPVDLTTSMNLIKIIRHRHSQSLT